MPANRPRMPHVCGCERVERRFFRRFALLGEVDLCQLFGTGLDDDGQRGHALYSASQAAIWVGVCAAIGPRHIEQRTSTAADDVEQLHLTTIACARVSGLRKTPKTTRHLVHYWSGKLPTSVPSSCPGFCP